MLHCNRCKMDIIGNKTVGPLCEGPLTGEPSEDVYPYIPKTISKATLIRVSGFIFLAVLIAMWSVRAITGNFYSWMPLVVLSALIAFLDICATIYTRTNPLKMSVCQIYLGMIACLIVDALTGRHGWSINWVLPFGFIGTMFLVLSLGLGLHMIFMDFVLYMLLDCVLSFLQLIFLKTGYTKIKITPIISIGSCLLFFLGILIFRWRDFRSASERYFNI